MALTKNDIVASVHELGFTKKTAVDTVESLLEIIKQTLEKGDDVLISLFKQTLEKGPLAPSRLLLACDDDTLVRRVRRLCDPEGLAAVPGGRRSPVGLRAGGASAFARPPLPADLPLPESMRVTDFGKYLQCPYRYALQRLLGLRVVEDAYPPFPAHDLRAPQRVVVALGAAIGAAGLAGRLRSVDVVAPTTQIPDLMPRPWAVERVTTEAPVAERATPTAFQQLRARIGSFLRR